MVFIEIGETLIILDIGLMTVGMHNRLIKDRFWRTIPEADLAIITEIPDPLVIVSFIKWQVLDTGENRGQPHPPADLGDP